MRLAMLGICLAMALALPLAADDWPMPRHDARNTSYTAQQITPPLKVAWRVPVKELGGLKLSSGGVVCLVKRNLLPRSPKALLGPEQRIDTVLLDASTGAVQKTIEGADPLYMKGDLLVVAYTERNASTSVRCYNWRTGRVRWSHAISGYVNGTLGAVVSGGCLYWAYLTASASYPSHLICLDMASGRLLGETLVDNGWGEGPLAVDRDRVYWGMGHFLNVLHSRDLKLVRKYYDYGNAYPILVDGLIATQGFSEMAQAFRLSDMKSLWRTRALRGDAHTLLPNAGPRKLVLEAMNDPVQIAALDAGSGKIVWRRPLRSSGSCVGCGRLVYVPGSHEHQPGKAGRGGGLYCFDSSTGKPVWQFERSGVYGGAVIAADGALYFQGSDGFLYKFVSARVRR